MSRDHEQSLSEVHGTVDTAQKGWRRLFSFLGPAYLVSVGYMDPGNWATDLAGGSHFGYSLIWVLLMSNIMAILLQGLSARLGIVRGRDLAQANRETYPKFINFILYVFAELAIAACDLAEVLGMAIGIQLLTGLPLIWGVAITALDTFLLLYLQRMGMRVMEAFIITLVAIISLCFLVQIIWAKPEISEIVTGFKPMFANEQALYIAIGIIGATVMPHNLYLHSALVQTRKIDRTEAGIRQAIRFNRIDSTIALNIAFLVNASILILAATVFFKTGNAHVAEIKEAHRLLPGFLGNTAPMLFAIALIAAGQSSTITGTLAGQIVMEGYLRLRINPLVRRILTRLIAIIPAVIIIGYFGESKADAMLIFSQVILSMQLGFAIIPLIHFVSDKEKMGQFAISTFTKIAAWVIAAVLIYLNIKMLAAEIGSIYQELSATLKSIILFFCFFLSAILLYVTTHPLFKRRSKSPTFRMHPSNSVLETFQAPGFKRVAIALDFSEDDSRIISFALGQGDNNSTYLLVHVVESASAIISKNQSDDHESREDKSRLDEYLQQMSGLKIKAEGYLGFHDRSREIIRIVKEQKADLLVIGAHGHKGLKDLLYGETVNAVRHGIDIPVLVVNL
jgi:manganese transport protein